MRTQLPLTYDLCHTYTVWVKQHYVTKFVSNLRQVCGFLSIINKTDCHDITEILLTVTLNTITLTQTVYVWHRSYVNGNCVRMIRTPPRRDVLDTTICDKVCQWLEAGRWFSPGIPVSSMNKTDNWNIVKSSVKHPNPNRLTFYGTHGKRCLIAGNWQLQANRCLLGDVVSYLIRFYGRGFSR
jgi:hypothetical protein